MNTTTFPADTDNAVSAVHAVNAVRQSHAPTGARALTIERFGSWTESHAGQVTYCVGPCSAQPMSHRAD